MAAFLFWQAVLHLSKTKISFKFPYMKICKATLNSAQGRFSNSAEIIKAVKSAQERSFLHRPNFSASFSPGFQSWLSKYFGGHVTKIGMSQQWVWLPKRFPLVMCYHQKQSSYLHVMKLVLLRFSLGHTSIITHC